MSNREMFAMARAYGDAVSNGLGQFKDYLAVENAINKNWQDALTFNENVNKINAVNSEAAFKAQEAEKQARGQAELAEYLAKQSINQDTGKLAAQDEVMANMRHNANALQNAYAILGLYDKNKTLSADLAKALAYADAVKAGQYNTAPYSDDYKVVSDGSGGVNFVNRDTGRTTGSVEGWAFPVSIYNPANLAATQAGQHYTELNKAMEHAYNLDRDNRQTDNNIRQYEAQYGFMDKNNANQFARELAVKNSGAANSGAATEASAGTGELSEAEARQIFKLANNGKEDGFYEVWKQPNSQDIFKRIAANINFGIKSTTKNLQTEKPPTPVADPAAGKTVTPSITGGAKQGK